MSAFSFSIPQTENEWQPAIDVYNAPWGWVLKLDIAGVRLDDVHVHVSKRAVTVSGIRRDWFLEESGCHHYSMEISYSRFQRTVELPDDLDTAMVRLDYRDGILFVRIAVREENNK